MVRCSGPVLSIAKLRVGQEAYQLSGVAQSLDDYYTGAGEADGQWMGACAERLGLVGPVVADDLRAILAGIAPGTGGLSPNGETIRPHPRRVPGFDLTFKAPKSVSVLYAVSDDPRVQGSIIEAGEAALRDTLGWLEREAVHVRRGTGNARFLDSLAARDPEAAEQARVRSLNARGVVAAVFRHRTSRSGDPLLHWHTLIPNLVEGPDGRWSAFVHPDLYSVVRTAGEVFQTVLRDQLTQRLGIEWRPGRHVPEVAGVPQPLCDTFSKRSRDIEAWLEANGLPDDRRGRQQAVLATRRAKPEVESERFDAAWKAEALAHGWGPDAAEALVASLTPAANAGIDDAWRLPERSVEAGSTPGNPDRIVGSEAWIADLLDAITVQDSTFTRAELVREVASRLGDGATMATLERVVARTLASPQLVPIASDRSTNQMWTSTSHLAIERRFLAALEPAHPRLPLPVGLIESAIAARPSIGEDQAAAARVLVGASTAVTVLIGPAGTGKTFTLDAVRAAYEAAGFRVIGAAPSARAALELEGGAGVEAFTLHRLAGQWNRGFDRPGSDTVLVIDEAGMAGIRDLESLVTATVEAGGRVVLAGDHHQLPEVTAGGGFAAAVSRGDVTLARLTVNRRQQEPWEQAALAELRDGHVAGAVAAYRDHGRVVVTGTRHDMLDVAVGRWFEAHSIGQAPVLLAGTNAMVDALNRAVRREVAERGLVGDVVGVFGGADYRVGERIVLRRNSYHERTTSGVETAVFNGQSATVVGVTGGDLVVRLDRDGAAVALPSAYTESGGIDFAYALTAHRAQGGTWDVSIGVGLDGLYREAGYLQLSRGRLENWLVVTADELATIDQDLDRHDSSLAVHDDDLDVEEDLTRRLNHSRAKLLASTHDPHAEQVRALAQHVPLDALEDWARYARQVELSASASVGLHPTGAEASMRRAEHTARRAAVGLIVKALDRHNIGTIIDLDDPGGAVLVEFVSEAGRAAQRRIAWHLVEIRDSNVSSRALGADAVASLDRFGREQRQHIDKWHQLLTRCRCGSRRRPHLQISS